MLLSMVKEIIAADEFCEVVAETADDQRLIEALDDTEADVIILTPKANDLAADHFSKLLNEHPRTRVLVIATDGHRAFVHALRPCVTEISELSAHTLLAAIRQSAFDDQRRVRDHG
jgi:DNA-binding NarL/FixJ family response regulator